MFPLVLLKTSPSFEPTWTARSEAERRLEAGGAAQPPVSGTVYGVVLNVGAQVEQMAQAMTGPPYMAPARAPVLYIKPPNTFLGHGGVVPVPAQAEALEVNATLAVVMGRSIGRADPAAVMEAVLGYTIAIDVCIPHASLYRPAIRQRCRDGFLPIGPWIVARDDVADPDALEVSVHVDGEARSRFSTSDLVRPVARLLSDIAAFSTLHAGDVVLVGLPPNGPQAGAGQTVVAEIAGVGRLQCRLARESGAEAAA